MTELDGKRKYTKRDEQIEPEKYTPPKPKYDLHEVTRMAKKVGMSYGKFVGLKYEQGITL